MPVVARKVSDGKKRAIIVKEVLKEGEEEEKENEFEATNILPSSSCFFDALPDHLKEEILLRVPGKSNNVGNIQRVSKSFHDVVNSSERLWKTMCEKEVGEEGAIVFREFGRKEERNISTRESTETELVWKKKYRMWCKGEDGIMRWGGRSESSETTVSDEPNWFPHENDGSTEEGGRGGENDEDDDYDRFSPRYLHRATQCGKDLTKVILFGGQSTSGFHNDVFFLDMNERKNPTHAFEKLHVSGEPPLPRCSGSIQTLRVFGNKPGLGREVIALFGGSQGYISGFQDDLLVLAPSDKKSNEDISMALERKSSLTWYEPTIIEKNPVHGRPAPRWGHATFARNGKLLVFGGSNTNACFNDFWECTLESTDDACPFAITATWKLLCPENRRAYESIPCPRAGATLCVVNDVAYLFGGCRVSTTFNDLWKFDLSETGDILWQQVTTTGLAPTPRVGHSMLTIGNRLIIQGGRGMQANSTVPGKMSTRGLAALQGLVFYESGFSVLDLSKMNWLPRQYPKAAEEEEEEEEEEKKESLTTNTEQNRDDVNVREHRTGHVMMLAPQGIILVGGLGYNARFQSDVQTVKLF